MFVLDEIGQAIGPKYSGREAVGGVVSETIYLPRSACLTQWLLGASWQHASQVCAHGRLSHDGKRPTHGARRLEASERRGLKVSELSGTSPWPWQSGRLASTLKRSPLPGSRRIKAAGRSRTQAPVGGLRCVKNLLRSGT
jgi:hypothetical protein